MEYKAAIMNKYKEFRFGNSLSKGERVYITEVDGTLIACRATKMQVQLVVKPGDFTYKTGDGWYDLRSVVIIKTCKHFKKGEKVLVEEREGRFWAYQENALEGYSIDKSNFKANTRKTPVSKTSATKVNIREPNERSAKKTGLSVETTVIADLPALAWSKQLRTKLRDNKLQTYTDELLTEHLYSINTVLEKQIAEPKWLTKKEAVEANNISKLLVQSGASYFRFIDDFPNV